MPPQDAITADALHAGGLVLRQPARGHRFGLDAVLLAAALAPSSGRALDLGAGVGQIGLMLAARAPALRVGLVEIQPALAQLARENAAANGMADRVEVFMLDVLSAKARRAAGLPNGCADVVTMNPPWLESASARVSADTSRARAHVVDHGEDDATSHETALARWMRAAAALLRPGGTLALIHRADALEAVLRACAGRFGAIEIVPVHPRADEAAIRIVLRGVRGSRGPLAVLPGVVLHEADGAFTPWAQALHRGATLLPTRKDRPRRAGPS